MWTSVPQMPLAMTFTTTRPAASARGASTSRTLMASGFSMIAAVIPPSCPPCAHPFTAPMVRPFTRDRWASQPRTIGGRTTRVEMAHSLAQKSPCWVMKLAM